MKTHHFLAFALLAFTACKKAESSPPLEPAPADKTAAPSPAPAPAPTPAPTTAQASDTVRAFLQAIGNGDVKAVEAMMADGFQLETETSHAHTCLDLASQPDRAAAATCAVDALREGGPALAKRVNGDAIAVQTSDAVVTVDASEKGYAEWSLRATVANVGGEMRITSASIGQSVIDD